jgi:hypothetical protein
MSHEEGVAAYLSFWNDRAQEKMSLDLKRFAETHRGMCLAAAGIQPTADSGSAEGYIGFGDD